MNDWKAQEYGMDNLAGVSIPPTPPPKTIFEEAALYKAQRDEARIEIARLKAQLKAGRQTE